MVALSGVETHLTASANNPCPHERPPSHWRKGRYVAPARKDQGGRHGVATRRRHSRRHADHGHQAFRHRPAIADNQTRWTYRELGQAASRVVALFRTLGLRKGHGVSL